MIHSPIKFTNNSKTREPDYHIKLDDIKKHVAQHVIPPKQLSAPKTKAPINGLEQLKRLLSHADRMDEKPRVSIWGATLDRLPVRKETRAAIRELEITIDRINELSEEGEEDDYFEVVNPTEYAVQKATDLVSESAKTIAGKFFKAWVSIEDKGGIRLTWSKRELKKEVRLVVPAVPGEKIYIYHEHYEEYGVRYNVSAKTLSKQLSWLNSK